MPRKSSEPRIGARLGALRAKRGFTQGTVARLAGVAPSYLSRVENEKVQPTFPTLWRIMRAMRADFPELLGPEGAKGKDARRGGCPVSYNGQCLLDLIRSEQGIARDSSKQFYSARQIRLLGRLTTWMRTARPERLRAIEVLLDALVEGTE